MKLGQAMKPITYMKNHASELLDEVVSTRRPMVVTQHGEPKLVIIDAKSYDQLQESLRMLKILSMSQAQLRAGEGIPQEEVFRRIAEKHGLQMEDGPRVQKDKTVKSAEKTPRRARTAAK